MDIKELVKKQKEYFLSGKTLDIHNRRNNLIKLKKIIKENEEKIMEALNKDLKKSQF